MTLPLAIAESVQVTAALQMLNCLLVHCRDSHSLQSRLTRGHLHKACQVKFWGVM